MKLIATLLLIVAPVFGFSDCTGLVYWSTLEPTISLAP